MSREAKHLILQLLRRDRGQRLGNGSEDYRAIIKHPFFARIDFEKLVNLEITPPYVPELRSDTDLSQFDERFTRIGIAQSVEQMPDPSKNEIFQGFSYVAPEVAMTLAKSYAQNYNDLPQIDEQPSMVQNMVENFQHATLESGSSSEHNQEGGIIETDMSIPVPSARIQLPED